MSGWISIPSRIGQPSPILSAACSEAVILPAFIAKFLIGRSSRAGQKQRQVLAKYGGIYRFTLTSAAMASLASPYRFIAKPPCAKGVAFRIGSTTANSRSALGPYM